MSASPYLTYRPVASDEDIETMRCIRNLCRQFMTRHRNEITQAEQLRWWQHLDHGQVRCYLFDYEGIAIGYGLIKMERLSPCGEEIVWLTGGLLPAYRGKGLGEQLFRQLIYLSSRRPWLEVRRENERARKLYEKLGFHVMEVTDEVLTMALAG